jgi:xanthine/CO dehydrogenase XdhC/CoxF family maturation factor
VASEITGKDPATIAVGVAADLLMRFERAQEHQSQPDQDRHDRAEQVVS